MQHFDLAIIGGGIVGLATAYRFNQRFPDKKIVVLEKEAAVAQHQSSHNSGVLHSGIYYAPGSSKAINCRDGKKALQAFCDQEGIPYEICGKVIVAVDDAEVPRLARILHRGQANGVRCELIDASRLHELEPNAAGIQAIHVPDTGIVDFHLVCLRLAQRIRERGATILTGARVLGIENRGSEVIAETTAGSVACLQLVNCAGLYSDRVAQLAGSHPDAQIVPFRGEYYKLKPSARSLVNNLIYPVPDPNFPFLGVHFTRMIGGEVECGPNAVLAASREGYTKTAVNLRDLAGSLTYPGFLRLAGRHWRAGLGEMWRSCSKSAFVAALKRLVPAIESKDLEHARAGVRAQAVAPDGSLVDDFLIEESPRVVNVCNAPSPAATASLNIGDQIVNRLAPRFT
jgi:L-2-hydroxyglutarate oxidase